jgi:hypothetical protein
MKYLSSIYENLFDGKLEGFSDYLKNVSIETFKRDFYNDLKLFIKSSRVKFPIDFERYPLTYDIVLNASEFVIEVMQQSYMSKNGRTAIPMVNYVRIIVNKDTLESLCESNYYVGVVRGGPTFKYMRESDFNVGVFPWSSYEFEPVSIRTLVEHVNDGLSPQFINIDSFYMDFKIKLEVHKKCVKDPSKCDYYFCKTFPEECPIDTMRIH